MRIGAAIGSDSQEKKLARAGGSVIRLWLMLEPAFTLAN